MSKLKTFYIFKMDSRASIEYLAFRNCYQKNDKDLTRMMKICKEQYPNDTIFLMQEVKEL